LGFLPGGDGLVKATKLNKGYPQKGKVLRQECGITLTHSRVAEWRRGKYTPSPRVLSHMLYRVYPWAIQRAGLRASEAQLDVIEDLLWKVNVADGERNIELL
jgi:hypothetical protein